MKCGHCGRYYTPVRSAALGTEPGYCQPSCMKRAIDAAGRAFQEWWEKVGYCKEEAKGA